MSMDSGTGMSREDQLPSRWGWYAAGGALLIASLMLRQPLLVMPGFLLIVLGLVPALWYRFGFSDLTFSRTLSQHRAEIGDEFSLTITVTNRALLPLPHLELIDEVPEEGLTFHGARLEASVKPLRMLLVNALSLWIAQRLERRYRVRCRARGLYAFGPVRLVSSDPFGVVSREMRLAAPEYLVVYPLVVPLERLGIPARALLGMIRTRRALIEDPLMMAGVRQYMHGDEPRRIHWKASARMSSLQSRVYDSVTHPALVMLVDVHTYPHGILGYDPALLELCLCTAASLAQWALDLDYSVGLYVNGLLADPASAADAEASDEAGGTGVSDDIAAARRSETSHSVRVAPSTHPQQIERIREVLARIVPYFAAPIPYVVTEAVPQLSYGSTVVYVGAAAALDRDAVVALESLRTHGHAVLLLLTGDTDPDDISLPWIRVGGAATWEQLISERTGDTTTGMRQDAESALREPHPVTPLDLGSAHA